MLYTNIEISASRNVLLQITDGLVNDRTVNLNPNFYDAVRHKN